MKRIALLGLVASMLACGGHFRATSGVGVKAQSDEISAQLDRLASQEEELASLAQRLETLELESRSHNNIAVGSWVVVFNARHKEEQPLALGRVESISSSGMVLFATCEPAEGKPTECVGCEGQGVPGFSIRGNNYKPRILVEDFGGWSPWEGLADPNLRFLPWDGIFISVIEPELFFQEEREFCLDQRIDLPPPGHGGEAEGPLPEAFSALQRSDRQKAMHSMTWILQSFPRLEDSQSAAGYYRLARLLAGRGHYHAASEVFARVLGDDKPSRGPSLYNPGEFHEPDAFLKRSLLHWRGKVLYELNRDAEAEEVFRQAVKMTQEGTIKSPLGFDYEPVFLAALRYNDGNKDQEVLDVVIQHLARWPGEFQVAQSLNSSFWQERRRALGYEKPTRLDSALHQLFHDERLKPALEKAEKAWLESQAKQKK